MAVEAISSSNDFFTFLMYETLYANNSCSNYPFKSSNNGVVLTPAEAHLNLHNPSLNFLSCPQPQPPTPSPLPPPGRSPLLPPGCSQPEAKETNSGHQKQENLGEVVPGMRKTKKRKRRRPSACKNREEAETQRLTHIVMERNRRKQMNEHLAALRSLMPESYAQRGDQASIVGGAIEYVKELEHILQSLEAQKLLSRQHQTSGETPSEEEGEQRDSTTVTISDYNHHPSACSSPRKLSNSFPPPPFSKFFSYPQYTWSQSPNQCITSTKTITTTIQATASTADIEVTLIETHANLRILSRKTPKQLLKLISGFQLLNLTILHLNVTSVHPLVLYSISAKVEEGCQLTSVDDIADATHQLLRMIEDEAAAATAALCY